MCHYLFGQKYILYLAYHKAIKHEPYTHMFGISSLEQIRIRFQNFKKTLTVELNKNLIIDLKKTPKNNETNEKKYGRCRRRRDIDGNEDDTVDEGEIKDERP